MRVYQVHFYYKNGDVFIKKVTAESRSSALKKIDEMITTRAEGIIFGYDHWLIEEYNENEKPCL